MPITNPKTYNPEIIGDLGEWLEWEGVGVFADRDTVSEVLTAGEAFGWAEQDD